MIFKALLYLWLKQRKGQGLKCIWMHTYKIGTYLDIQITTLVCNQLMVTDFKKYCNYTWLLLSDYMY